MIYCIVCIQLLFASLSVVFGPSIVYLPCKFCIMAVLVSLFTVVSFCPKKPGPPLRPLCCSRKASRGLPHAAVLVPAASPLAVARAGHRKPDGRRERRRQGDSSRGGLGRRGGTALGTSTWRRAGASSARIRPGGEPIQPLRRRICWSRPSARRLARCLGASGGGSCCVAVRDAAGRHAEAASGNGGGGLGHQSWRPVGARRAGCSWGQQ